MNRTEITFGLGSFVAVFLSAATNHSFWWGFLHFFMGWIYVIYWVIYHTGLIQGLMK